VYNLEIHNMLTSSFHCPTEQHNVTWTFIIVLWF